MVFGRGATRPTEPVRHHTLTRYPSQGLADLAAPRGPRRTTDRQHRQRIRRAPPQHQPEIRQIQMAGKGLSEVDLPWFCFVTLLAKKWRIAR